ncbi:hypothetical protein J1N35_026424 [Gossypium stocksii]|uniref:Uncharacterized protein n=1 Tax=Gossypium stocksii TaxID=47602 RepID=A0A9D3V992_9ROSI|nr:hypothetical protein J1N35_026424 [Gossypium stocksii]
MRRLFEEDDGGGDMVINEKQGDKAFFKVILTLSNKSSSRKGIEDGDIILKEGDAVIEVENSVMEDYTKTLSESLWIIYSHYLTIQPWMKTLSMVQDYPLNLVSWIWLLGLSRAMYKKSQQVEYESLPNIYFECGCYGHMRELCSAAQHKSDMDGREEVAPEPMEKMEPRVMKKAFGPWMIVQ